jgi:hypothetical protein
MHAIRTGARPQMGDHIALDDGGLKFILIVVRVAGIAWTEAKKRLLSEPRNLPSYELHQKLEEKYHETV